MDILATKLELLQYILNSDKESVLAKFRLIMEKDKKRDIVGYTANGVALSVDDMNEKLVKAEEDFKAGRIISDEDLNAEIETW